MLTFKKPPVDLQRDRQMENYNAVQAKVSEITEGSEDENTPTLAELQGAILELVEIVVGE